MNPEGLAAIEFWKSQGHGLSCPNPNQKGGKKNKKLKGGTLPGHSKIIDSIICAIESRTTFYDLPIDILVKILIDAKEGSEDANKIVETMSLVSKNFQNLRSELVANQTNLPNAERITEVRQELLKKYNLKGYFVFAEQVHIFCNFLENIIKNFTDTINGSGLEILFTKKFVHNGTTYDVVYNQIIFTKGKITYKLCGQDNIIQYKINDPNNRNTNFIKSSDPDNPDTDLIRAIRTARYQQIELVPSDRLKEIDIKYDKPLFEQLYYYFVKYDDSVIGDYVTEPIIYKIIDNDYYVQIPNEDEKLAIANIQILPAIYKQLKIDTDSIFKKFADNMAIENLFETYKKIFKENPPEIKEPPNSSNVQKESFDFSRLYDVYFTKDEIMKITFYSMKKLKEDPQNSNFIKLFQEYIQRINNPDLSAEEKTQYTELHTNLRQLRKAQILAEIDADIKNIK